MTHILVDSCSPGQTEAAQKTGLQLHTGGIRAYMTLKLNSCALPVSSAAQTQCIKILIWTFLCSFPCVAYHHWPRLPLVTSCLMISWLTTSALPLALAPTLCCCSCRTRSVSEGPVCHRVCWRTRSEMFLWIFTDFITSVRKLVCWYVRCIKQGSSESCGRAAFPHDAVCSSWCDNELFHYFLFHTSSTALHSARPDLLFILVVFQFLLY